MDAHQVSISRLDLRRALPHLRTVIVVTILLWAPYAYLMANFERYGLVFPNYYGAAWQQATHSVHPPTDTTNGQATPVSVGPTLPGRYRLSIDSLTNEQIGSLHYIEIVNSYTGAIVYRDEGTHNPGQTMYEFDLPAAPGLDIIIDASHHPLLALNLTRLRIYPGKIWPAITQELQTGLDYFVEHPAY